MSSTAFKPTTPLGNPTVATLLTWLVPGAGHLYLGRMGMALFAFLAVEVTFAIGFWLSDGRVWEFLQPELRGAWATLLSPEMGNMGGWLFVKQLRAYGPGYPRLFPDGIHLGSMLMGLSGILNVGFMVRAHLDARIGAARKGLAPSLAVVATWVLPGLGHFLQGRKKRALIVGAMLIGLFVVGTVLAEGSNLSRERHFYYWGGQFFLGLPAVLAELVMGRSPVSHEVAYMDVGLLFASMAGLLNIMGMLDVYTWGEDVELDRDPVDERRKKRAEKSS